MNLSPEERQVGQDNYYSAVSAFDEIHRRDFLKKSIAGGAGVAAGLGAMYFGYNQPRRPIRISVIGTGDEGNVLIGAMNPEYVEVVSICDIRPSSIHRAFHGDWATPNALVARPGLMSVFGWETEEEARKNVQVKEDYRDVINDDRVEGIIIALPLHLHAKVAIEAMRAGKHVLVEKLMARNIAQCKLMARTSNELKRQLSVGHQRHYSILYDNAVNLVKWGLLGEIHHIRAQWHRNNMPGSDSWAPPIPGGEKIGRGDKVYDKIGEQLGKYKNALKKADSRSAERLSKQIRQWTEWDLDKTVAAEKFGYVNDPQIRNDGRMRSALEELVRWRLWDRTSGGLMAELGSHQLDASSILISALSKKVGHHVHPMTVHGIGGRHLFPGDRDAADHVYCSFEFPGQGYDYDFKAGYQDKVLEYPNERTGIPSYEESDNKKIVVSYSSINGNGYGGYGEHVYGTKGTLVLDREKYVMLYPLKDKTTRIGVKGNDQSAVLDTSASGDPAPAQAAESSAPVSRGYKEEIEHWAWCISTGDWDNQPRCNGEVALADAVIALTANLAIQKSQSNSPTGGFIRFKPDWFDVDSDAVPESDFIQSNAPTVSRERSDLA